MAPAFKQHICGQFRAGKGNKPSHGLPVAGHGEDFAMHHAVDDLAALVSKLPNRHISHVHSVSRVRHTGPLRLFRDIRPDQEMESSVSAWLIDTVLPSREAEQGLHRLLETFPATPPRPGIDEHDHPPETHNRRIRLMLSASALTAAIAVLAVTVNTFMPQPVPRDTVALVGSSGTSYHSTMKAYGSTTSAGHSLLGSGHPRQ